METKDGNTPITGKEGAVIDIGVAADWTKYHRDRCPGGTISQFFGCEILQRLLQQPGCMGIRIYYANSKPLNGWQRFIVSIANFCIKVLANAEGEVHFVLAGVTKEGLDQIPLRTEDAVRTFTTNVAATATTTDTVLVEQAHPCPGSAGCPQNVLTGS